MKHGMSEETGNILQQLGWVRLAPLAKDVRPIQDFAQIVTVLLSYPTYCSLGMLAP